METEQLVIFYQFYRYRFYLRCFVPNFFSSLFVSQGDDDPVTVTIRHYADEVERMRSSLAESQAMAEVMRKEIAKWKKAAMSGKPAGAMEASVVAPFKVHQTLFFLLREKQYGIFSGGQGAHRRGDVCIRRVCA